MRGGGRQQPRRRAQATTAAALLAVVLLCAVPNPAASPPPSSPRACLPQGPRGELQRTFHPLVVIAQEGQVVKVTRAEEGRVANQQHGLARTLLNNMVVGVDTGFTTTLSVSRAAHGMRAHGGCARGLAPADDGLGSCAAGAAGRRGQAACWVLGCRHPGGWLAPPLLVGRSSLEGAGATAAAAAGPGTHSLTWPPHCPLPLLPPAPPLPQMIGVGYRAAVNGNNLTLNLGYSHPVEMPIPAGLAVSEWASQRAQGQQGRDSRPGMGRQPACMQACRMGGAGCGGSQAAAMLRLLPPRCCV